MIDFTQAEAKFILNELTQAVESVYEGPLTDFVNGPLPVLVAHPERFELPKEDYDLYVSSITKLQTFIGA